MSRKPREENQQAAVAEYSYTSAASATEMVDHSAELIDPAPLIGSAVDKRDSMIAQVQGPKKYRVVADALVMNRGTRTLLRSGKIIDESNYDMAQLNAQGVRYEDHAS